MGSLGVLIASIAAGPMLIIGWAIIYPSGCWTMAIPLAMVTILTLAALDRARHRRRCMADCYFEEGSWINRLVSSMRLITLMALVVASGLTAVLLVNVAEADDNVLAVLALDSH